MHFKARLGTLFPNGTFEPNGTSSPALLLGIYPEKFNDARTSASTNSISSPRNPLARHHTPPQHPSPVGLASQAGTSVAVTNSVPAQPPGHSRSHGWSVKTVGTASAQLHPGVMVDVCMHIMRKQVEQTLVVDVTVGQGRGFSAAATAPAATMVATMARPLMMRDGDSGEWPGEEER